MQTQFLVNGKSDNTLTPWDRGFAYGDGVFRTLVVRHGIPDGWRRHYRKLSEDCHALGIVCPPRELLMAEIAQLCHGDADATIKIIVTRGEGLRGYAVPPLAKPTRVLVKSPLPHYPKQNYSQGVSLHLCQMRLSSQPRLAGIKHLNRLENVLARMEWSDTNLADGLLLDMSGNVIECTASNIFMRTGDVIKTPDLSSCGVAGVTRQRIIEFASRLGLDVEITSVTLDELMQSDEVVICNSLYGAWQVRQLNGAKWPQGNLANQLQQLLHEDDTFAA